MLNGIKVTSIIDYISVINNVFKLPKVNNDKNAGIATAKQ